jgi:NitT/TauT family transport system substrate-binding protein
MSYASLKTRKQSSAFRLAILIALSAACSLGMVGNSFAEENSVSLSKQFGLAFLPLVVMQDKGLVEKAAAKNGLPDVKVTWATLGGGASANDALLSGSVDFVSGGAGPLIKLWSATKGNSDVKGVASISAMPFTLTTVDPRVKTIADFTDRDRIALPAAKVSMQAITLQMAAAKLFGKDRYDQLDKWTVSMRNPDALIAMLSGHSGITAHFSGPPFPSQELQDPRVHEVLNSYDVLGGPGMLVSLYTTEKYRAQHPRMYKAVLEALNESDRIINADKRAAAESYIRVTHSKLSVDFIYKIIADPRVEFSAVPRNVMKYADFMYETHTIKHHPASWKDIFFPEIHDLPGS